MTGGQIVKNFHFVAAVMQSKNAVTADITGTSSYNYHKYPLKYLISFPDPADQNVLLSQLKRAISSSVSGRYSPCSRAGSSFNAPILIRLSAVTSLPTAAIILLT